MGMSGLDLFLGAKAYMCSCAIRSAIRSRLCACAIKISFWHHCRASSQSVTRGVSKRSIRPLCNVFVIKFLPKEGVKPVEILRRLRAQFGESNLSQTRVYEWHKSFLKGRETVENESHQRRPRTMNEEQ